MTSITEVPWMIEGGAVHSVQVARNMAYSAFGGREGIVGAKDLEVRETAVPGNTIRVFPGTCGIFNRAAGARDELYVFRNGNEVEVPISATGASARSDMIVARVENPWAAGESWANPTDPTVGPYASLAVISGVDPAATTVADLGLAADHSLIPLARIDLPASTGTVTQDLVTDLRVMANPRRDRIYEILTAPPITCTNVETEWTRLTVTVPEWATTYRLRVDCSTWLDSVATEVYDVQLLVRKDSVAGSVIASDQNTFNLAAFSQITGMARAAKTSIIGPAATITVGVFDLVLTGIQNYGTPGHVELVGPIVVDIEFVEDLQSNV